MNSLSDFDTDQLLQSAAAGAPGAVDVLLNRYRDRLKRLVAVRLDAQVAARVDASDVVQDALLLAHPRLDEFVREKSVAFYPWLRQITLNRIVDLYRYHRLAAKRSVEREHVNVLGINDDSVQQLAAQIIDSASSPSRQVLRAELKGRMMEALQHLTEQDREIVVMRHLEELSVKEIAEVLDLPAGTVMTRHYQAVRQLRSVLND